VSSPSHESLITLDPEAAAALGRVFEDAWAALEISGSPLVQPPQADQAREALALRIIDAAPKGERDPRRLQEDAIAYLEGSLLSDTSGA
jgi:hypothetical protein